jgi:hypothetical protein
MSEKSEKIRELNDSFRTSFQGGRVLITPGISDRNDLALILTRVQQFESFDEDNDPYGERDFGAFDHAGQKFFWKIDYYDADLNHGSEDPTEPAVTTRVLTVMLAEEY